MSDSADRPVRERDNFLVFGAPLIGEDEKREVLDCLETGWLGTGPKVGRFEKAFAEYKGAEHAVAVNSCTAALHLSMVAAGLGPGDEVIAPAMTFCSTINAVLHVGATPVLADVDPRTYTLDLADVERRITPRTKALLPVHFAGRPCEMDELEELRKRHGLKLIEDCAHSIETEYKGRAAGLFGDYGCFSFYVTKNLATGEGGMVLTADGEAADRIKALALHGMSKDAWNRYGDDGYRHYYVVECGFKYNMMDIQAALGIHQLAALETNWLRRERVWRRYQRELADLPLRLPAEPAAETRHGYHLYTVLVEEDAPLDRDAMLGAMTRQGIGVGVHYQAIPEHPYYQERFGWRPEQWPVSWDVGRRTVSLPLSPKLTDEDVTDVVTAVRKVVGR